MSSGASASQNIWQKLMKAGQNGAESYDKIVQGRFTIKLHQKLP